MTGELINDVTNIIKYSQAYPFDIDVKPLLQEWFSAKKSLIASFGGNLVVRSEKPITVTITKEEQEEDFENFMYKIDALQLLEKEFKDFLMANKAGFFENRVISDYPNKNIKKGTKLLRAFKNFFVDMAELRCVQNVASQFIQHGKIHGYLYLSVDPRDFLTLSENNENWSSCCSLSGEYRTGNFNHMTDEVTAVAYLANDELQTIKYVPPETKWYSKKWRMLIHFAESGIYYNRPYPFFCKPLIDEVYKLIVATTHYYERPNGFGFKIIQNSFGDKEILDQSFIGFNGDVILQTKELVDRSDLLGYCDLTESSSYAPILSLESYGLITSKYGKTLKDCVKEHLKIKIGAKSPCVCCGEDTVDVGDSFLCKKCRDKHGAWSDFFMTCDECGKRLADDEINWYEDVPYCPACYEFNFG